MPDDQGRMNLLEMRVAVWRNLAGLYVGIIDPATGREGVDVRIDPLFSAEDIDRWLNEALTGYFLDITDNSAEIFADEAPLDVVANVPEIELPEDMAFFRSAWWKDPSIATMQVPPSERSFMFGVDDNPSIRVDDLSGAGNVPRYRLQLDFIVLDPPCPVDNPQGVLVRYIKWAQYLAQDTQIIESQFARLLQECIVLEAAISGAGRKAFLDTSALQQSLAIWKERLVRASRGYVNQTSAFLTTSHPIRLRGAAAGGRMGRRRVFEA